jgi:hypothetical protein
VNRKYYIYLLYVSQPRVLMTIRLEASGVLEYYYHQVFEESKNRLRNTARRAGCRFAACCLRKTHLEYFTYTPRACLP